MEGEGDASRRVKEGVGRAGECGKERRKKEQERMDGKMKEREGVIGKEGSDSWERCTPYTPLFPFHSIIHLHKVTSYVMLVWEM